mmetsp:Transcript_8893/g.22330  ORF Transcript_8893/g.22330 Transcript_8893/m.22330 type:complete len:244 (+) Transcript_8893:426-1157(+)
MYLCSHPATSLTICCPNPAFTLPQVRRCILRRTWTTAGLEALSATGATAPTLTLPTPLSSCLVSYLSPPRRTPSSPSPPSPSPSTRRSPRPSNQKSSSCSQLSPPCRLTMEPRRTLSRIPPCRPSWRWLTRRILPWSTIMMSKTMARWTRNRTTRWCRTRWICLPCSRKTPLSQRLSKPPSSSTCPRKSLTATMPHASSPPSPTSPGCHLRRWRSCPVGVLPRAGSCSRRPKSPRLPRSPSRQ